MINVFPGLSDVPFFCEGTVLKGILLDSSPATEVLFKHKRLIKGFITTKLLVN